jgi:hypothetical protein
VLDSTEDVTNRVNSAVTPNLTPEKAAAARSSIIAQIEKESTDKTGLRTNVITLFEGGSYQLYRYKEYTERDELSFPSAKLYRGVSGDRPKERLPFLPVN